AVALEHRVRLQVDNDVQVARRPAVDPRLAFASEADAVVLVDARRDLDRQRLVFPHAARAGARLAGVRDDLARAVTLRARLLDREEALRHPHFAAAMARRARLRLRSRLGAAAVTRHARTPWP